MSKVTNTILIISGISIIAIHLIIYRCWLPHKDWAMIASMVSGLVGIAIAYQAFNTKKQVEISAKSIAFSIPGVVFVLRSLCTIYKRGGKIDVWQKLPTIDKLKTLFVIQNNSKTPISLKVRVTYKFNNKEIAKNHYWEKPLSINPGITRYPDVIHLEEILKKNEGNKSLEDIVKDNENEEIIVNIEYKYSPKDFEAYSDSRTERRNFILNKFIWEGPDGTKDENIHLPGENYVL